MKSTMKKAIVSVCLALTFLCAAVVCGVMLLANGNNSSSSTASSLATAEELTTPSQLILESESTSWRQGDTVVIHATFKNTESRYWFAAQATIVPLDAEGNPDLSLLQYFTCTLEDEETYDLLYKLPGEFNGRFRNYSLSSVMNKLNVSDDNEKGIMLMLAAGPSLSSYASTQYNPEFEFQLTLKDTVPEDLTSITFGINSTLSTNLASTVASSSTANSSSTEKSDTGYNGNFSANTITFRLRDENTETNVEEIVIGGITDEDGEDVEDIVIGSDDITKDNDGNGSATIYLPDTPDKTVVINPPAMLEDSEGATAKVGVNGSTDTAPADSDYSDIGTGGKEVTVSGEENIIHISVKSEDGKKTNEYVITVIFTYVRLSNLTAESDLPADSPEIEKNGIEEEFDSNTWDYTVNIPSNAIANTTKVTPTVAEGYGASESVKIQKLSGSCSVQTTVQSGNSFTVMNVADDDKLQLTVTAMDGTTTKNYTITFKVVSIDAELDGDNAIVVKSVHLQKESTNNEAKATEKGVDYFFNIVDDVTPVKATMVITTSNSDATIEVKSSTGAYEDYNAETQYGIGSYVIKVTAAAGNSEEYTVILSTITALKLASDSKFDFVMLNTEIRGTETLHYRKSYTSLNWTHGIDDIDNEDVEKFVISDISPQTTLQTLVQNIDSSQWSDLRIYNMYRNNSSGGELLVYDRGTFISGISSNDQLVGTGWRIEYGSGETMDVVYISILGDVDGDSYSSAVDLSSISNYIAAAETYTLEQSIAAHIANGGNVTAVDLSALANVIANFETIESHFCNPQTT